MHLQARRRMHAHFNEKSHTHAHLPTTPPPPPRAPMRPPGQRHAHISLRPPRHRARPGGVWRQRARGPAPLGAAADWRFGGRKDGKPGGIKAARGGVAGARGRGARAQRPGPCGGWRRAPCGPRVARALGEQARRGGGCGEWQAWRVLWSLHAGPRARLQQSHMWVLVEGQRAGQPGCAQYSRTCAHARFLLPGPNPSRLLGPDPTISPPSPPPRHAHRRRTAARGATWRRPRGCARSR